MGPLTSAHTSPAATRLPVNTSRSLWQAFNRSTINRHSSSHQHKKKLIYNTKGNKLAQKSASLKWPDASHADRPSAHTRGSQLTVHVFEDVENGEDLPVVGHQSFAHQVGGEHQVLQDFQGGTDHLAVPRVQGICKAKEGWLVQAGGCQYTNSWYIKWIEWFQPVQQHQTINLNPTYGPFNLKAFDLDWRHRNQPFQMYCKGGSASRSPSYLASICTQLHLPLKGRTKGGMMTVDVDGQGDQPHHYRARQTEKGE